MDSKNSYQYGQAQPMSDPYAQPQHHPQPVMYAPYPPPQQQAVYTAYPNQPQYSQPAYPQPAYPPQQTQPPYKSEPYFQAAQPPPVKVEPVTKENDSSGQPKGIAFTNKSIRRGFIRKVFGILSVQLTLTFGIVLLFCMHKGTNEYVRHNFWVALVGFGVSIVTIIPLACCQSVRRTFPINLIFLGLLTIAEGIMAGILGALYGRDAVMIAMGLTAIMVIGLMIFACQTKWDFTKLSGGLFIALLIFSVAGIIGAFIRSNALELVLSAVGVVLFSIYLIHDTQLIMDGGRKNQLNPEEYILGALMLYLDILRIFIYILRIVGAVTSKT